MSKKRAYRVPKKIATRASGALGASRVDGVGINTTDAVAVAVALSSSLPVQSDVPEAMAAFFTADWRHNPAKLAVAELYGGEAGRDWAKRCVSMLAAAEPASDLDDEYTVEELFEFTEAETAAILSFLTGLAERSPEAAEAVETVSEVVGAEEMSARSMELSDAGVVEEPEEAESEGLEEIVETALGLATQLDETVEKLADALEDAVEDDDDEDDEDEELEASMVRDALAEVVYDGISLNELTATDFSAEAAEARERMAKAALVRQRSLAMAKMASARMTLAAAGEPVAQEGAEAPADADPKAPTTDHHSASQPRDWHGRFAKVGARVRSKGGTLGFVKGIENGQLVVEDDDGNTATVDPKSIEVVTKESRARLPEPMKPLEDPKARLEAYLEWAREQMGIGGAS